MVLRDRYVNLDADLVPARPADGGFHDHHWLSARLKLLREVAGRWFGCWQSGASARYCKTCWGWASKALSLDPRLGILAGSVALTGGPATAIAWGGTFEKMGVAGAAAVGGLRDLRYRGRRLMAATSAVWLIRRTVGRWGRP